MTEMERVCRLVHQIIFVYLHDRERDYAKALAEKMGARTSFYFVNANIGPSTTLEYAAAVCVRELQTMPHTGPWVIAGASWGALAAFEICSQLVGAGLSIDSLIIIDLGGSFDPPSAGDAFFSNVDPATASRFAKRGSLVYARDGELQDYTFIPLPTRILIGMRDPVEGRVLPPTPHFGENVKFFRLPPGIAPLHADESLALVSGHIIYLLSDSITESVITRAPYDPLVTLQIGAGHADPLILIPGAGASVTSFVELVSCLDNDRAVYSLQPRGMEDLCLPYTTVEYAASEYANAIIKSLKPSRIHLLGHSFGGWVAMAMSQRLAAAAFEIISLTLLDSSPPDPVASVPKDVPRIEVLTKWIRAMELNSGLALEVTRSDLHGLPERDQIRLIHNALITAGLMHKRTESETLLGPFRVFARCLRTSYAPLSAYSGPVRLLLASTPLPAAAFDYPRRESLQLSWSSTAPSLLTQTVPGNHFTLLKLPHVRALAETLLSTTPAEGDS